MFSDVTGTIDPYNSETFGHSMITMINTVALVHEFPILGVNLPHRSNFWKISRGVICDLSHGLTPLYKISYLQMNGLVAVQLCHVPVHVCKCTQLHTH